jgi:thioredoxin-like negative regulator of GroEL
LLYFTATWCAACRANEKTFAALRSRGWKIGPGEENHIQIIDLDLRPDLKSRYRVNAIPAWVLIDDGRELRRRCGPLDPFAVGRLFGG